MKLRIDAHLWLFLAVKFTNKAWLQGATPAEWSRYTDYFLGEKVNELKVPRGDSMEPLRPPWQVILHYEFECRKWAIKQVREKGASLLASLHLAIRDPELKEIHFTSPIALGQRVRDRPRGRGSPP